MADENSRRLAYDKLRNFMDRLGSWLTWRRLIFLMFLFFLGSTLFPFYRNVSSSFKTRAEIGSREPVYIPESLNLNAYQELFD